MKKKSYGIYYFLLIAVVVVFGALLFVGGKSSVTNTFPSNTTVNGVDISGKTLDEAKYLLINKFDNDAYDVNLTLRYNDMVWQYGKNNFTLQTNLEDILEKKQSQSIFSRLTNKNSDNAVTVGYKLKNPNETIEEIISQIEQPVQDATITFNPDAINEEMFVITQEQVGREVDRAKLADLMLNTFYTKQTEIDIPVIETQPNITAEDLEKSKKLQSTFSTNYSTSASERKNNVKVATENINGTRVNPGEEFSFNLVVGERTKENGFMEANIISDGKFVKGVGGGVCQVSTTLYNAVIRAGVKVTEANKHSLPVSYVPLAFDAMVSWGYSDLKFTNDTELPIFIKGYADGNDVTFEIYGATLEDNESIKTRAEFIGTIPHQGDKIIPDTNGEYSDKILFKGEYLRVKYPQEGYHSKAYLQYYVDGKLQKEELIRDERYEPQQGIVYEGVEDLPEGMTLPNNSVSIIPPQTEVIKDNDTAIQNINIKNPTNFNP